MTTPFLQFLLITTAAVVLSARAQEAEPLRWTLEEFRTRCIPLWTNDPTVEAEDCTVAEFGEIAELDGVRFHYARYHDRRRPIPNWSTLAPVTEFNALVILRMDPPDRDEATVFHVRKQTEDSWFDTFDAPELLQTDRGPILYLLGRGLGAGMSQYGYDEYWLWQPGTWVPLDVHGWGYTARERMPAGFWLAGIDSTELTRAMTTMTYVSYVLRDDDAMCCPSGGTVRIQFEWDDLTLRVVSLEHDPRGQLTN